MKKLIYLLLLLPLLHCNKTDDSPGGGDCEVLNVLPDIPGWSVDVIDCLYTFGYNVDYFYFFDKNNGYARGSTLVHSTNGGNSWPVVPNFPNQFLSNSRLISGAFDGSLKVLYDSIESSLTYQVLVSTPDMGQTFTKKVYDGQWPLTRLAFIDESKGFALGFGQDKFALLETNDGGENWDEIQGTDFPVVNSVNELVFKTPDFGYVFMGQTKYAYVTTDGGANWKTVSADIANNDVIFYFDTPGRYFATSSQETVRSTDGGATWQKIADYSIYILTMKGDDGVAIARDPDCPNLGIAYAFLTTTDGGLTWTWTKHTDAAISFVAQELEPGTYVIHNSVGANQFIWITKD
ncbi:MAG: hypothetical protein R2791_09015 [Saprospiraceae bacterium]